MEEEAKYLHSVNNLDDKYSSPQNCKIVEDSSIINSYNNATTSNESAPTLSQLTTSTAILNPASVGCQMEDHSDLTSTTVIKNEDVTYVMNTFPLIN